MPRPHGAMMRFRAASISRRLPLSVAAIVVVVTSIMAGLAYVEVKRRLVAVATERLERVTTQVQGMLEQNARQAHTALSRLAWNDSVLTVLTAADRHSDERRQAAVDALMAHVRASAGTRSLEVWDARATPLLSAVPGVASLEPDVRAALTSGLAAHPRGFTGAYRWVADTLESATIVAIRRDSEVRGYLVQRRRLTGNPQSVRALTELIGRDSRMLVGSRSGELWTDLSGPASGVPDGYATAAGVVRYHRAGGEAVLARVVPVEGTEWLLALEFLEAPILAHAREFLLRALTLVLLLSIGGASLGIVVSRAITRPLQAVTHAATALAGGATATRVDLERQDELGQLATAFNTMAEQIEQGRAHLAAAMQRYRLLFNQNPTPMWVFDRASLAFLDVNEAAVRHYGYSREEFLRLNLRDIRPDAEIPKLVAALAEPRDGPPRGTLWKHQRKDGSLIDVEITRTDIDLQGQAATLALVNDVTQRLEAERLVAASRTQIEVQLGRLKALRAIDRAILSTTDLPLLLKSVLQEIRTQLQCDVAVIFLFNPHTMTVDPAASIGYRTVSAERERVSLGDGVAGRAARERRTIAVPNLPELAMSEPLRQIVQREELQSVCAVPLIAKGQLIGVLDVLFRHHFDPGDDWIEFCEALAGQAAMAIESGQSFEELQHANLELRLAYDRTIEGWSRALDLRDKETEGHTQRVTEMTVRLARLAGIGDAELVHVRRGALLHDIGKMGVPDAILHKPGPLTEAEWEVMRLHPVFAIELLSPIEYLRPALDIPYCHHERWDGSGYPRRLKGEQIPLASRLFSVVDVWDALRSDRPYRAGWPDDRVRAHLAQEAGSSLDPMAVQLFLQLLQEEVSAPASDLEVAAAPMSL